MNFSAAKTGTQMYSTRFPHLFASANVERRETCHVYIFSSIFNVQKKQGKVLSDGNIYIFNYNIYFKYIQMDKTIKNTR